MKTQKNLPKSVVIIGAGAAGVFAARRLRQLGVTEITLLEKEPTVGGKCSTYFDPNVPTLKAERGASVVAPNYGIVLEAIAEKGLSLEHVLPAKLDNLDFVAELQNISFAVKSKIAFKLIRELLIFARMVWIYKAACRNMQPLPAAFELPFAQLAASKGLNLLNSLLKPFVPGFGYGAMEDCPSYCVLEYMGYTTILYLLAQHFGLPGLELMHIREGFQVLIEKIAQDYNVLTSVDILHVAREGKRGVITYKHINKVASIEADALIFATSPLQWEKILGPGGLTSVEQECIEQLKYYRYPVAVCYLKGGLPNEIFVPEAFERENFGHVAFVSTRDKRIDPAQGRLCTAYVNVPPAENKWFCDVGQEMTQKIKQELHRLPGVEGVTLAEVKIWEDYFPCLPWSTRLKLEAQQFNPATKTIYVGSYTLGAFEDVSSVANSTTDMINRCFGCPVSSAARIKNDVSTFFTFVKKVWQAD